MTKITERHLFTGIFILMLGLFGGSTLAQNKYYFPPRGAVWQNKSPETMKVNKQKLDKAIAFAQANEYSGSRDLRRAILKSFRREPFHKILGPVKKRGAPAGMILKNGYVIAQWGDNKRVDMTFSVTKSYLSTMAGLALDEHLINSLNDKVGQYVWNGKFAGKHNAKVTWAHLLTQSSDWYGQLWGGYDWADRPPKTGNIDDWQRRKLHEPGTYFEYNDVRVNLLAYSLLQVWRKPLPQVLKEKVMDKIGASSTWRWFGYDNSWVNVDGNKVQSVSGGGHSGGGLFINTEDHARFGLLFLNEGKWKGQQIFSPQWIKAATTPSKANVNYGYMWWLNKKGKRHWQGVSEDVYYAAGFGGNFIVIDKAHDLVIVTRWLEPSKIGEMVKKVMDAL